MSRYSYLDKRIQTGDVALLREALGNMVFGCRNFSDGEFDGAVQYVESKGIKIKEDVLRGELVSTGKSSYTADDFADAITELKENFCDERINDVKKIGRALYPPKEKPQVESAPKTSPATQFSASRASRQVGTSRPKSSRHQNRKWVLAAALLVAVVAVIAILIKAL